GPERDRVECGANHSCSCGAPPLSAASYGKNLCRTFAVVTAAIAPQKVATMVVEMIAVGFFDPDAASTAMMVAGMNWIPAVFKVMKVTMAFDAVSFCGLISCSSSIALMPSGVAAFERPSMFAAMFMIIAPMAGWSAGISG